jgi:hypothetical protein
MGGDALALLVALRCAPTDTITFRWRVFDVAEYTGGQFAIEPIGAELARLAAFSDFKAV